MVAIGEIIHGFKLFIDDADAGFVRTAGDVSDVRGGFALIGKLLVDAFGGFDSSLGVELG